MVETTKPQPMTIGGREFIWGRRTYIMGVVNVTPDSFSGDGLAHDMAGAVSPRARAGRGGSGCGGMSGERCPRLPPRAGGGGRGRRVRRARGGDAQSARPRLP